VVVGDGAGGFGAGLRRVAGAEGVTLRDRSSAGRGWPARAGYAERQRAIKALSANMSETARSKEFSVEGE
jgi:hypothetical protein